MVHHLHQYSMTIFCTTLQHSNMACRKALQRWSHSSHVEKCDFQWPLIPRIQALAFRHPTCMLESHHAYMWFTHWNRMNQRCPLKLWMFHCIGFLEELPMCIADTPLLVGGIPTPLKNDGVRQLGSLFPIYGKMKNVPNHQPVYLINHY